MSGEGAEAPRIVLWTDTAPAEVEIVVHPRPRAGVRRLGLYNVWRGEHGETQAWVGSAGLLIDADSSGNLVRLRCSCGSGGVDFDDLVVSVHTEGAAYTGSSPSSRAKSRSG